MSLTHSRDVLRAYREVLLLIRRLPPSQRTSALQQARSEAQADKLIKDAAEVLEKIKQMHARISYLRSATPRQAGDGRQLGAGVFVLRDGKLVPSAARPESRVADGKMTMEEARTRNQSLLTRQHFGRDPGRYEIPF